MKIKFLNSVIVTIGICFESYIAIAADEQDFTIQKICKATIAQVMGRSPSIINTSLESNGIVKLFYIREDDRSKWVYRCRIEGSTIVWANDKGRWRNSSYDSKISYRVANGTLYIDEVYGDGSSTNGQYKLSDLND